VKFDKLVVLVAPTGGNAADREGVHIPTTPEEIAAEAYRCHQAGASVVHIHARDGATKQATSDLSVFSSIIAGIRAKCDALIQTTTGMGMNSVQIRPTEDERLALLSVQPPQDLTTVALGTWDIWRPYGGHNKKDTTYRNTPEFLRRNIRAILERGIPWELEIADIGFLANAMRLAEEGVFDKSATDFWLDYCLGFGGMPADARTLVFAQEQGRRLFPQAKWAVVATGSDQFPMSILAASMGCDIVRVGFEDNIYLPNGRPAKSNAELVEAMVRIARDLGREVATVDEARTIFGLKGARP
jgi:3-keto-5-aminohexanoate cleavage enzyme